MTNREWILEKMKNMSDEELGGKLPVSRFDKNWCKQDCVGKNCSECVSEWLKKEHKEPIKLFEAERVILENIEKNYKWIARDKFNMLGIYEVKPIKEGGVWIGNHKVDIKIFGHLFQFIKWEDDEPYNIDDLLQ